MQDGITSVKLRNFRSYSYLDLPITSKSVAITGKNGAGKTSILEAISLFSSTKGLRKAKLEELKYNIAPLSAGWRSDVTVSQLHSVSYLSTFSDGIRRSGSIDESPISSLAKFEDILWFLWIVPEMHSIFLEHSHIKRSFFDHLVTGIEAKHYFRLKYLQKLLKERLHILQHSGNHIWLSSIEEKMTDLFIKINSTRMEFIEALNSIFQTMYSSYFYPHIQCLGGLEEVLSNPHDMDVKTTVLERLSKNRALDLEKQTTSFGVHRSNWEVYSKDKKLSANNCSSGEQKTMLIFLILAAVSIYKEFRSGTPVLLLDDVMMHLDEQTRKLMMNKATELDVQVFFTGTDKYLFSGSPEGTQFIEVKDSVCYTEY